MGRRPAGKLEITPRIESELRVPERVPGPGLRFESRACPKSIVRLLEISVKADLVAVPACGGQCFEFLTGREPTFDVLLEEPVAFTGDFPVPESEVPLGLYMFRRSIRAGNDHASPGDSQKLVKVALSRFAGDVFQHVDAHCQIETLVLKRKSVAVERVVGFFTGHVDRCYRRIWHEHGQFTTVSSYIENRSGVAGQSGDYRVALEGIGRHRPFLEIHSGHGVKGG